MVESTLLRKLNIEQHEPNWSEIMFSGMVSSPAPLATPVV
jgi:hypothetical protein